MTWEGSLYAIEGACTGGDMSPPYNGFCDIDMGGEFVRSREFLHRRAESSRPTARVRSTAVGRGHVPAVREAAGGTDEQVCTQSAVPAHGGDVSPPYRDTIRLFMFLRTAHNSRAEVGDGDLAFMSAEVFV